jgi:hypothetical protein
VSGRAPNRPLRYRGRATSKDVEVPVADVYYAISSGADEDGRFVFGKGGDPAEAEAEALTNIAGRDDAAVLRQNLIVVTRPEAESQNLIVPGAPVIWYDHLRRYQVEDHGPFRPLKIEYMIRDRMK